MDQLLQQNGYVSKEASAAALEELKKIVSQWVWIKIINKNNKKIIIRNSVIRCPTGRIWLLPDGGPHFQLGHRHNLPIARKEEPGRGETPIFRGIRMQIEGEAGVQGQLTVLPTLQGPKDKLFN